MERSLSLKTVHKNSRKLIQQYKKKNRINTSLLSIERSFIFKGENDKQDGSDLI